MTSTDAASVSCSAWLMRSAATCTGSAVVVGEHRDLGRAGLGVDADHAAHQPLRGGDVDVARAGDDVHRLDAAGGVAVGRERDRLRAADRVHLADAEQRARREDRRVRPAAVTPSGPGRTPRSTRRRRPGRAPRSSRRWTGRPRARPARRARPGATGIQRSVTVPPGTTWTSTVSRRCASCTSRARRIDSVSAARTCGSRAVERGSQRVGRYPRFGDVDAVEAQRRVTRGRVATGRDVLDDRRHRLERCMDVDRGAGQHPAQVGGPTAQIETS